MADSQVLRWLDELNGITDADSKAREIKSEIRRLRKEQNSVQNRRRIKQLYAQLDDIQFKPDYMCLIIDKEKDYHRACSGFSINGLKYQRLLGTNGGVKNETIVFVSERHAEEIRRRIDNGRDPEKEMVPAKLEAYKALTCSASTPVLSLIHISYAIVLSSSEHNTLGWSTQTDTTCHQWNFLYSHPLRKPRLGS